MAWPAKSVTMTPGSTLNLRSGPSTSTSVLYSIPNGSSLTLTGPPTNGWYPVNINGRTGYVSAQYVAAPSPTTGTTPPPGTGTTPPPGTGNGAPVPAWPQSATTKTPGSTLNFRAGPSTGTAVLGSIPHGGTISLTGPAVNGWYPASYNGKTGYVSAQYVNAPAPPSGGGGGPTTPTTPPPPPNVPHTPNDPNTPEGSNPYYSPDSTYGSHQNWWDTPIVKQTQNPQAEWERSITEQGYGGNNRLSGIARDLLSRAELGWKAASMNNPNLDFRSYQSTLGPNFIRDQIAGMTPTQKGESHAVFAPTARWTPR